MNSNIQFSTGYDSVDSSSSIDTGYPLSNPIRIPEVLRPDEIVRRDLVRGTATLETALKAWLDEWSWPYIDVNKFVRGFSQHIRKRGIWYLLKLYARHNPGLRGRIFWYFQVMLRAFLSNMYGGPAIHFRDCSDLATDTIFAKMFGAQQSLNGEDSEDNEDGEDGKTEVLQFEPMDGLTDNISPTN